MKNKLVLSLGSNLGNRYAYLQQAIVSINEAFDTIGLVAQFYQSPPWGDTNQSSFLNTAMVLETTYTPDHCIRLLQEIEAEIGRTKTRKWGPRTIDIDILFYEDEIISKPNLQVPHPHLQDRAFVLVPLHDLVPNFKHPVYTMTIREMLHKIEDNTILFNL